MPLGDKAKVGMPCCRAHSSPGASGLSEATIATTYGVAGDTAASASAIMFEPRPEIRIPTRRFISSTFPGEGRGPVATGPILGPGQRRGRENKKTEPVWLAGPA